ncbi:unnamed protein product [Euphydryas editha]|uniref:Uncharacterized protein n=1 Tax=Euphydryas editha TaxID=104508 RepID=A0AAU9U892_EUPED|nr:unnamed protein product [Euphydryas editha]
MEVLNSDRSVTEKYDHLIEQLSQIRAVKAITFIDTKISERTIELLEERKAILTDKSKRKENRNTISSLSKLIRENIRNDNERDNGK